MTTKFDVGDEVFVPFKVTDIYIDGTGATYHLRSDSLIGGAVYSRSKESGLKLKKKANVKNEEEAN